MSTEYKPLFNRTYLQILVVGSVLAILWLSSLDSEAPAPQGQLENQPLYWLQVDDTDPQTGLADQLQVILPTDSALSSAEQDRQHWRAAILNERLHQQLGNEYRYTVEVADDYLSFSLFSNNQTLPALTPLLDALQQPVDADQWQAQLKKVQAQRYLNQKSAEQQLLAKLGNQLGDSGTLPLHWAELFEQPRYLLAGDDAEERADALAAQLPTWQSRNSSNSPTAMLAGSTRLDISSARSLLLMANTLPGRANGEFIRQHLIAATSLLALERFPPGSDTHFRMQMKVLQHDGYQAVVLSSELPLNDQQLQTFRDRITPELVDEARPELRQRFQNVNGNPRWQLNALQRIARYQLPLDALQQFLTELDQLDSAQIAAEARKRFDPQQQYSLRVDIQP